jgi:transposase
MAKRKRRTFSVEFKAEAVRLCKIGDRSISKVAEDLGLTDSALREWVKATEVSEVKAAETSAASALSSAEREELERLRRDVKRLQMEREILKKAAAFFAKESE